MKLFSDDYVKNYIERKKAQVEDEIESLSDDEITGSSIEDWVSYYCSKFKIEPIEVYVDKVKLDLSETKIKEYDRWARDLYDGQDYFLVDGYKIAFIIPFYGDSELFKLRPMSYICTKFEVERISSQNENNQGYIEYVIEFKRDDLKKFDDKNAEIMNRFNVRFENYLTMINNVNKEAEGFNLNLENIVREQLQNRLEKAKDFADLKKALQIPLNLKKDAPKIAPIPLKKMRKIEKPKPKNRFQEPEYYVSDDDYRNIISIIHHTCSAMETTAEVFNKLCEEELRDIINSNLASHYVNGVTGETFRKIGKTDIHIIFENKSAFIGECKIWSGIRKFTDAVDQLFGYSTWKDKKLALIIFNKDVKNFEGILNAIENWVKQNAVSYQRDYANVWRCKIYREDTGSNVQLAIQVYDISL